MMQQSLSGTSAMAIQHACHLTDQIPPVAKVLRFQQEGCCFTHDLIPYLAMAVSLTKHTLVSV